MMMGDENCQTPNERASRIFGSKRSSVLLQKLICSIRFFSFTVLYKLFCTAAAQNPNEPTNKAPQKGKRKRQKENIACRGGPVRVYNIENDDLLQMRRKRDE
jgi:hypothetical protein